MGWVELMGWLDVMRVQTEPRTVTPESWEGASEDPWWREARAKRDADRGR
jgi:hypothetical protein